MNQNTMTHHSNPVAGYCSRIRIDSTGPAHVPNSRRSNEDVVDDSPFLSMRALIGRGWTRRLINTWLGEPDRLVRNRNLAGSAMLPLFRRDRVEGVERQDDFGRHFKKSLAHQVKHSRNGAIRHEVIMLNRAAEAPITVPLLTMAELDAGAQREKGASLRKPMPNRKCRHLCYLLNHAMTIDRELFQLTGLPNARRAAWLYRSRLFAAIAAAYPHLAICCQTCHQGEVRAFLSSNK